MGRLGNLQSFKTHVFRYYFAHLISLIYFYYRLTDVFLYTPCHLGCFPFHAIHWKTYIESRIKSEILKVYIG